MAANTKKQQNISVGIFSTNPVFKYGIHTYGIKKPNANKNNITPMIEKNFNG